MNAAAPVERPARVFFALWPDAVTARRLHAHALDAQSRCGGRAMRRDTLHLTLAFIGDVTPARLGELLHVGDATAPAAFTLGIDRVGGWRHNRIVWAGAEQCPDPLAALVARLGAGLAAAGFPVERRPFAAHVTLLRNTREQPALSPLEPIPWNVEAFGLYRSRLGPEGARYEPVREWGVRGVGGVEAAGAETPV